MDQIIIATFGILSCWFTGKGNTKLACMFGLCAEPAWIWSSIKAEQWGIFILALVYSFLWSKGLYYACTKKS